MSKSILVSSPNPPKSSNSQSFRVRKQEASQEAFFMAAVYILHSKSADEFYTGSTKDPDQRLEYHLIKAFQFCKVCFTKQCERNIIK